jgi:hypothetical protein
MEQQENWGHEAESEIPVTELAEFDALVDRSFEIEKELADIKLSQIDPLSKELADCNTRILATLKHHNKGNYRSRLGMVVKAEKFSVKFPKNPDDKMSLIRHMGSETYMEMSTVNYNTFNGWYKAKMEEAADSGIMDFQVPGVEEPKYVEYLQRRKG